MTTVIKLAKLEDAKYMKEINEKCLAENYPLEFWKYYTLFQNSFISYIDDVPVGYIFCNDEGSIWSFAILENHRNKGLGKQLMEICINNLIAKEIKSAELQVRISNEHALKLYKSFGFNIIEIKEKYYDDGENGYLMTRNLN
jgi:ribosomal-protein-alanine N-acetyltransferase